jgi:hypothetical protein
MDVRVDTVVRAGPPRGDARGDGHAAEVEATTSLGVHRVLVNVEAIPR